MIRVAFDIGGTFTDLVLQDTRTGRMVAHKIPSTPAELSRAVMDGLSALLRRCDTEAQALAIVRSFIEQQPQ